MTRDPAVRGRARAWLRGDVLIMLVLFAVALIPRAAWTVYNDREPQGLHDPTFYLIARDHIADGTGYVLLSGEKTAFYPVGYPATLAALKKAGEYAGWGTSVFAARLMNGVFGAITVLLVYLVGLRVFDRRMGIAAALLQAVFPGQIYYAGSILSDAEFTMLLLAATLVLAWHPWSREGMSWQRLFGAGLLLSAATMVRGIMLLYPLALLVLWLPYLHSKRTAVRQSLIVLAGIAVLTVPWSIRNSIVFHTPTGPSTNLGNDLCIGNAVGATGGFWPIVKCFGEPDGLSPKDREIQVNNDGIRIAIEDVVAHPARMPLLVLKKARELLQGDDEGLVAAQSYGDDVFMSGRRVRILGNIANAVYYATGAVAILGALWFASGSDVRRGFLMLTLLYVLAIPLVFFGAQQFHYPAIPLVALVAASTAVAVWGRLRAAVRPRVVAVPG